jgi:aspartyl aminopeptidase
MLEQDIFNQQLLTFLDASPTPFHAVATAESLLVTQGFQKLAEKEDWPAIESGKYYVTRQDSSLIAFTLPKNYQQQPLNFLAAHTDSPTLKLKPNPALVREGFGQLTTEVYGGALLNPWFDRDLGLAGMIYYQDNQQTLGKILFDSKQAIGVIPSLAIHLDRDANKQRSINPQTDITPIIMLSEEKFCWHKLLRDFAPSLNDKFILEADLFFYDRQPAALVGAKQEFIASARLDNLLSCFILLQSLFLAEQPTFLILSNHEEVGSGSFAGAGGTFLQDTFNRLFPKTKEQALLRANALAISTDNAHAVHPNFADKHDQQHKPKINQGPVLKFNANQRYASSGQGAARFRAACREAKIPLQDFVMRNDLACGSTIGPIMAERFGVETLDIGVPTLAMHSIREVAGNKDAHLLYQALSHFLH